MSNTRRTKSDEHKRMVLTRRAKEERAYKEAGLPRKERRALVYGMTMRNAVMRYSAERPRSVLDVLDVLDGRKDTATQGNP